MHSLSASSSHCHHNCNIGANGSSKAAFSMDYNRPGVVMLLTMATATAPPINGKGEHEREGERFSSEAAA